MTDVPNRQLLTITGLVQLEKRARHAATPEEFGFLAVNETHALVRYRQAVLWRCGPKGGARGGGQVVALSGLAVPDRNAPFVVWLRRLLRHLDTAGQGTGQAGDAKAVAALTAADAGPDLGGDWSEWLPAHALAVPLSSPEGERLGVLLLARDEPWNDHERHLLAYLADAYGHAWAYLLRRFRPGGARRWLVGRRNAVAGALAVALFAAAWIPVRDSALAQAEVIPRAPVVVRAPVEGVVDRFAVRPNELVEEGQLLLALDATRIANRLDVAAKAFEVAEAEYRQGGQQALFDPKSKANLAILQGRMEQHAAEVAYLQELLGRIEIRAPRAGTAIFDDENDWIGRPVAIGERILTVADPRETELEIRLPVADAIPLEEGAPVRLFLNVDPQNPVAATLTYAGYQASPGPDGVPAYRLKARFEDAATPRIGLKGVAKVHGSRTTLFYYVMRRPLAALRQRVGL
ncbi:efflux RND transporter periplasmic adaptor subunit [Arenibaculum sp.]|uniref:efflux RND transporter periplasmic adaptor subunit n=1 Tax=Arenibaculum sp. TaxID=2865862 RepID=UPI002E158102|nr:HlyD family efflux transporter periplasmic adaptor subunit [Arenibaculum sp.]